MTITEGKTAPAFTLADQNGNKVSLKDLRGQHVILYFYPRDDTPGCTKEACAMRDNMPRFKEIDFHVIGISVDDVKSHKRFAEKYRLSFDLLADEKKEVVRAYGVWGKKKFMGREFMGTLRTTFLVDPLGKIARIYEKVKPEQHAEEVLEDFQAVR